MIYIIVILHYYMYVSPIVDYLFSIAYFILLIDCLLLALDAHKFSHTGYGPGTKAQGPKAAGPQPIYAQRQ